MKTVEDLAFAIREYVTRSYITPARQRGLKRFSVRVGDVHREMGFTDNRVPAVCSALKKRSFLGENQLRIVERSGPPSGQSTTVTYTYEFVESGDVAAEKDPFQDLRGSLKEVFAALGGGEKFIKAERAALEQSAREDR